MKSKLLGLTASSSRSGIGGDWVDVMLNYRYQF